MPTTMAVLHIASLFLLRSRGGLEERLLLPELIWLEFLKDMRAATIG
jgi:hypothetical protein